MIKPIHSLCLTLLITLLIGVGYTHADTTFELLTDAGSTAQMIGIGNIEGFDDSAASVLENPAALDRIHHASFSGFYTSFNDGQVNFYSYATAYRLPKGVIGVGIMQTSIPDIHQTAANSSDEFESLRTFTYRNAIYKLAYAYPLNHYTRVGMGLNYMSQEILDVRGNGVNADIGALFEYDDMAFSVAAKQFLGFDIQYTGAGKEKAPTQYVLASKLPFLTDGMSLYNQYKILSSKNRGVTSIALRYLPPSLEETFGLSVAWQQYAVIKDIESKWTFGLTLDLGEIEVGFAYEQAEYFKQNGQYYFSISYDL